MDRKLTVAAIMVATIAVLAASCTLPAPAERTWKVSPVSVEVVDQEDWDAGDEPYVIQLGFRSKLGVVGSSDSWVASQGTVVPIPPGGADIAFPEAQNVDIGDLLFETAALEIFGTMTLVMERDVLIGTCAWTETINATLPGLLRDSLNLLVAGADVPPTEEDLINLIVGLIDDFIAFVPGAIAIAVEGLGDPDDMLGTAIQIHLPTAGAFTNALDLGLTLAGLDNGIIEIEDIPGNIAIRVGKLLPSTAAFTFTGPGYEHIYTSRVTA